MPTLSHHESSRLRIYAVCVLLAAIAACGKDSAGPGTGPATSVEFTTQPSTAITGEAIDPAVEVVVRDANGRPVRETVTLELDSNPCGWNLGGTLTAQVSGSTARFPDLTLDMVGKGFTLRASAAGLSAMSSAFDVHSSVLTEPLLLENIMCSGVNPIDDFESLTYVPEDDAFWGGDDNRNLIYAIDRRTGVPGSQITLDMIFGALPDAGQCDDGDGDPNTVCSYVEQFEHLTYDPTGQALYVLNVVDSPADRPAVFRLTKGACAGCFTPESWQPLPVGPWYNGVVVAEGQMYLAVKGRVYTYDYGTNQLATVDANGDSLPPAYANVSAVKGMSYDGTFMWILTNNRVVHQVEWAASTEQASFALEPFGFSAPRGMAVVGDSIYALEGDAPSPIYVFRRRAP